MLSLQPARVGVLLFGNDLGERIGIRDNGEFAFLRVNQRQNSLWLGGPDRGGTSFGRFVVHLTLTRREMLWR